MMYDPPAPYKIKRIIGKPHVFSIHADNVTLESHESESLVRAFYRIIGDVNPDKRFRMFSQELGVTTASDSDLEYSLLSQRIKLNQVVKWNRFPRHESLYITKKPVIDSTVECWTEFSLSDVIPKVVSHGVAFPPTAVRILPLAGLFRRLR